MEISIQLLDTILFFYFLVIAFAVPFLDAQTILPSNIFPDILVQFKTWFTYEFGNYLLAERPHFFIGIAWLELLLAWPLSIASIYGIAAAKSWLPITCLLYGVYFFTALVAILFELVGSGKASQKLLLFYFTFLGFAILSILRGFLPLSSKLKVVSERPRRLVTKKRA
uniref:sigma intracellular receptor 2-like n=1 Tax=Erigeron canadensis TaxID=72917 RepID=UPI001CB99D2F|nr:sigma intracellular receptor 2-like [Erigeron canadensis]